MEDTDLVHCARQGSAEAYTVLVERYRQAIYALAYHHLQDFDAAQDVAQETFVRGYMCLEQLRDPGKFGPWLRQVAVNECRMWQRRRRWELPLDCRPETASGDARIETRLEVRRALACLSEAARLTVILFYMQQSSLNEIAAFLEVPLTTVKSRLRNARTQLRKELEEMVETNLKTEKLPEDFATRVRQLLHGSAIFSLDFSPDGKRLASGSQDGSVKIWEAQSGELLRTLVGHTHLVDTLCFSPDSTLLGSAGADRTLRLWEVETGRLLRTLGEGERPYSIAFSPEGSLLAHAQCRMDDSAGIVTSAIQLRRVAPGEALGRPVHELTRIAGSSQSAVIPADGPEGERGMLYSVAFSPDGAYLATGTGLEQGRVIVGGEVKLWETGTWRLVWTIPVADYMVKSVAFAPDGRTLAAGCSRFEPALKDGQYTGISSEVRIWQTANGAPVGTLAKEDVDATIQRIVYSPDGRQIVVYRFREYNHKNAEIWEVASGGRLQSFAGAGHAQGLVAYAPDCRSLASAGSDTSLHIWRIS